MRRIITFLFILMAVAANARQISPDEAQSIAAEFFGGSPKHVSPKGVKRVAPKDMTADNQPYYVFNAADNAGFVIISGDDRARKILGYSDKGKFDFNNLPPQLDWLLKEYGKQIESIPASASQDPSWLSTDTPAEGEGVLLETANWGQGAPYNAQCPVIDGVQAPTGCVATAMAIVMKYHNWPESYNWDAMPISDVTAENSSETAKLMSDAGKAVLMSYGPYESGAKMNWVGHKLQQDFKYSPECQYITAQNFSNEEWIGMLRGNIDNGQPVIYSGTDKSRWVSHAFIIDGYTDSGYHINWGWEGLCNGYYTLDALRPDENSDYSSDCGMVINITPDRSGKEYSKCFVDYGYFWATGGLATGSHFSIDAPAKNQKFDYSCAVISYPCVESGQLGLLLYDKDGNVKEVLKTTTFTELRDDFGSGIWSNDILFSNVAIASEILPDDYIAISTRQSLSHPWLEVLGTIEAPVKRVIADIKKDVGHIKIINNTRGYRINRQDMDRGWSELPPEETMIELVLRANFALQVIEESGVQSENVTITVKGTGLYGDTYVSHEGYVSFIVYGDSYTITIDETLAGIEKAVNLTDAGNLPKALSDTPISNIEALTITGFINAKDLWFIRDNIKSLKALDISNATIVACEATDPVEAFQISGSDHSDDALPTYALTGLTKLKTLNLPKGLKYIESNSMMSLAITRIEIPATVQAIGLNVFFDCVNLETIVSRIAQPIAITECVFRNTKCPSSGVLYIPTGSHEAYSNTAVWQDFAQIIEDDNPPLDTDIIMHEGLKYRVHGRALYLIGYEQSQLAKDVVIPDVISVNGYDCNVLGIDDNAMQLSEINSFTMSNTITTIGSDLFSGSTVKKVWMSDNIKKLPFHSIDGSFIEELHLPENAESICNTIYCPSLKRLHLPKKIKSEIGYNGSIGSEFQSLEQITVDPENEEWSVHDGILYWKGLSYLILIPNSMSGEIAIPDETIHINEIRYCNNITKITFGHGIKTLFAWGTISNCHNLKHLDFNNNIIIMTGWVINDLPSLESFTIRDFVLSSDYCFGILPSLQYVYLLNENPVDFSKTFYSGVNEAHDYFTSSLNPQVTVPDWSKIYVAGGVKTYSQNRSNDKYEEMWSYDIDRNHNLIKIEPAIDGIDITSVVVNGETVTPTSGCYYEIVPSDNLDVVVNYTLHERQAMTTHYDAEFNAQIPDTELSLPIVATSIEITPASVQGEVGAEYQLTATVMPENATDKSVEWSSDNTDVATVDANGLLSLLAQGTATITATAVDGSGVQSQCQVIVDTQTGIENVLIDADTEVKIYSTTGVLLFEGKYSDAKLDEGIYVVVTRDNRFKRLIK